MLRVHDLALLLAFIALKVWLVLSWPLLGSEAHWLSLGGDYLLGYYDHPPFMAWVVNLMASQGESLWWFRSVGLVGSALLAWAVYGLLGVAEPSLVFRRRHFLAALAFFVSPASLLLLTVSPHGLVAVLGFLGVALYSVAILRRSFTWVGPALLFMGAAVLTSHWAWVPFIGLLLFSVTRHALIGWSIPIATALGLAGFGAINFYYNFSHCWNNVHPGFFLAIEEAALGHENLLAYLLTMLLLIGPWSIWYWRRCGARYTGIWQSELGRIVLWSALPMLLLLGFVSLWVGVGLLWPILFVPILWLVFRALPEAALLGLFRWSALTSLALGVGAFFFLQDPARWVMASERQGLAVVTQADAICNDLSALDGPLFTLDPSARSSLAVVCKRAEVHVFASMSSQGRQDDINLDLRSLDGGELHFLLVNAEAIARIEPFFDSVTAQPIAGANGSFVLARGTGFRYASYREQVLIPMVRRFYEAPYWFPQPGGCPIKERYGL